MIKRIQGWFVKLSFWKKIIIIFTLNTLILLILTDAIMLVLFGKISDDIISISNIEKQQFNQISNTQVAGAVAKMTLSKIDLYGDYLNQLNNIYLYFNSNPNLYTSFETNNNYIIKLTNTFIKPDYSQPALYFMNIS